jgi:hypothetical protein
MRDGIDRDGRHLYPVLPYPHFIRATDDDIAAIYAFLMTRTPLERVAQPNELVFPFNWRPLLAGWNLLFLTPGQWEPTRQRTRNGTRVPTWWTRSAIAAPATRRTTPPAPNRSTGR